MIHAKLSASGSSRWMRCAGSIQMSESIPNESSAFALEGSAAHCVADGLGRKIYDAQELVNTQHYYNSDIDQVSTQMSAPCVLITEEMVDHAVNYVSYINALDGQKMFEVRVDFSRWVPEGFGTSDNLTFDGHTGTLHVVDLKYGMGVKVYADNNSQLMLYALGAYDNFKAIYDIRHIAMHIYQPRLDHFDLCEISVSELLDFADEVSVAAQLALSKNPPLSAGKEQCKFCPARGQCPEQAADSLRKAGLEFGTFDEVMSQVMVAQMVEGKPCPDLSIPALMDDATLSMLLEAVGDVKSWVSHVEEHAQKRMRDSKGKALVGWKFVEGRSLRQWSDVDAAEKLLRGIVGDEKAFKKTLVTVAQAAKLLGPDANKKIAALVHKPLGKPVLALASDKRPELSLADGSEFTV